MEDTDEVVAVVEAEDVVDTTHITVVVEDVVVVVEGEEEEEGEIPLPLPGALRLVTTQTKNGIW